MEDAVRGDHAFAIVSDLVRYERIKSVSTDFSTILVLIKDCTQGGEMWRALLFVFVVASAGGGYLYMFDRARLERMLDGTPIELPATHTEVYKWRDATGHWHITDAPPEGDIKFETMTYRSDDNIMPLAPVEE